MKAYLARVKHFDDANFAVTFPDFPGTVIQGGAGDEVLPVARQAMLEAIAALMAAGLPLPNPVEAEYSALADDLIAVPLSLDPGPPTIALEEIRRLAKKLYIQARRAQREERAAMLVARYEKDAEGLFGDSRRNWAGHFVEMNSFMAQFKKLLGIGEQKPIAREQSPWALLGEFKNLSETGKPPRHRAKA